MNSVASGSKETLCITLMDPSEARGRVAGRLPHDCDGVGRIGSQPIYPPGQLAHERFPKVQRIHSTQVYLKPNM